MFADIDDENVALPILSRSSVIFSPGIAFTVGMSSSAVEGYFDEADFDGIIASLRIGA